MGTLSAHFYPITAEELLEDISEGAAFLVLSLISLSVVSSFHATNVSFNFSMFQFSYHE